jgi:hypothetical protein
MYHHDHNYTERTYHCIIMHIFKAQTQKQSKIKLNKQSINLIDFVCLYNYEF